MATVKLVLASYKNKKGESPLQVRYVRGKDNFPISVNISLREEDVDYARFRVKRSVPEWVAVNKHIDEIEARLKRILSKYPDADVKLVKEMYNFEIQQDEERKQNEELAAIGTKGMRVITSLEVEEKEEQINQLKAEQAELKASPYYSVKDSNLESLKDLRDSFDEFLRRYSTKVKPQSLRNYPQLKNILLFDFLESDYYKKAASRGLVMCWHNLNEDLFEVFKVYCYEERKYGDGNWGKMVKMLKTWLKYSQMTMKKSISDDYKAFKRTRPVLDDFIIIKEDEIDMIWNERNSVTDRERKVLDLMVFVWLTGLRINEALKNGLVLEPHGDKIYLTGETDKNDSEYFLPTWRDPKNRIITLLEEYQYNLKLCTDVEVNRVGKLLLKRLYEKWGIHQKSKPIYKIKHGKKVFNGTKYRYELFTTRTLRRSAIWHWYYIWGWRKEKIMAMVGNKDIDVINVYIRKQKEDKVKMFEND
ncbi:hypothetical protein GXP67_19525 [Rhodocytophaga rosea]|uniref:Arm DNA-binding domain-containing protein n=1 Tax=Rhodocytophaga rosea TaxID=2704465 RepID=A0A6C0GL54_9BACT|nr:hypothetical protein [Rhodocytophaga rosea]QHT68677.1 hypothetical protein GXP67_19525 [Rhodocytophaga rosea]